MRDSLHTQLKLFKRKKKTIRFACRREKKNIFWIQLTNYQVDANTINNFLSTAKHFSTYNRTIIFQTGVFRSIYSQQS